VEDAPYPHTTDVKIDIVAKYGPTSFKFGLWRSDKLPSAGFLVKFLEDIFVFFGT